MRSRARPRVAPPEARSPAATTDAGHLLVASLAFATQTTDGVTVGFDLDALAPVAERVGPTPALLGQDPSRRTDPAAVAGARWWKDEYQVRPPV